jgi:hypothetical protein
MIYHRVFGGNALDTRELPAEGANATRRERISECAKCLLRNYELADHFRLRSGRAQAAQLEREAKPLEGPSSAVDQIEAGQAVLAPYERHWSGSAMATRRRSGRCPNLLDCQALAGAAGGRTREEGPEHPGHLFVILHQTDELRLALDRMQSRLAVLKEESISESLRKFAATHSEALG